MGPESFQIPNKPHLKLRHDSVLELRCLVQVIASFRMLDLNLERIELLLQGLDLSYAASLEIPSFREVFLYVQGVKMLKGHFTRRQHCVQQSQLVRIHF